MKQNNAIECAECCLKMKITIDRYEFEILYDSVFSNNYEDLEDFKTELMYRLFIDKYDRETKCDRGIQCLGDSCGCKK